MRVYGMPKVVYEAGLADIQVPLSDIFFIIDKKGFRSYKAYAVNSKFFCHKKFFYAADVCKQPDSVSVSGFNRLSFTGRGTVPSVF